MPHGADLALLHAARLHRSERLLADDGALAIDDIDRVVGVDVDDPLRVARDGRRRMRAPRGVDAARDVFGAAADQLGARRRARSEEHQQRGNQAKQRRA